MSEKTPRLRPYQIRPPVTEVYNPLPLNADQQRKAGQLSLSNDIGSGKPFPGCPMDDPRDLAEHMSDIDNDPSSDL